jgi:TolB-like protein/tRNA A-37 threonylcarbamoyl transferase component Bud32/tetratricopeptide (TPR) repeat protein
VTDPLESLRVALEGRYTVERLIGQGGMATVYLARDYRHDRLVAIKVLRPELAASIGSDRFLREIKVAAHLQHPHVLPLYDSGEAAGFLYYVMPFIEGESLRGRLDREEQLSLPEAIQLTCEVADALQYAHNHKIIHRDIKPENILIQEGHALVADFGIARAVSEAGGDKLTETGMAVGTPHYMSPEQALGGNHIDGRGDLYSLGCVFYEMLVGQPPFQGPNAMAILARHSMEAVPSLQVVRHSIPDEIEDAVMRALEKTPADRFPTVQAFAEALCHVDLGPTARRNSHRAIRAVRRTTPREMAAQRKHPKLPRWAVAAGTLVVLAGAGWGAWRVWHHPEVTSASNAGGLDLHRIAVLYFQGNREFARVLGRDVKQDPMRYLSEGLTEGLIRELDQIQGLEVISPGGVAPYRGVSVSRDSIARALRAGTLILGEIERDNDQLRVTVRLVDGSSGAEFERTSFAEPADKLLAVQDTLIQKTASLIRERLGEEIRLRGQRNRTRSADAWVLVQQAGLHRKAAQAAADGVDSTLVQREFRAADSLLTRAEALDQSWAEPILGRGTIAYLQSRLAGDDPLVASRWIQQGLKQADRALKVAPQNPDGLELRGNLQYLRWLMNLETDPLKARALLKSAQADLESAVRLAPGQAGAWASLSHLYYQTGNLVDVKLAARRAYEEDAYLSNAETVLQRLFYVSYDLGQFPDALHWCEEVRIRFPENPKSIECQLYLMTSKGTDPDVDKAWRLSDSLVRITPEREREYQRLNAHMMVAATIARTGLADSARHVAQRSRGRPEIDPTRDLSYAEAFVRTLLGDRDEAIKALKVYLAANPEKRAALAEDASWWFRSLQDDSRFRDLVGTAQ